MGTVTALPKRGSAWVLEELSERVLDRARIIGFAFGEDGGAGSVMPDEIHLSDLLLARAILDSVILRMMRTIQGD